jgi:two-component system sensor histidine kinase KdpD
LIEDVLDRLRPIVQQHRIQLTAARDLPVLLLDPVEISEVIYNLVENAAKYSPPDTPIEIDAQRDGAVARVAISDHGAGIPQSALAHLFEPFYRVLDNPTPKGLGLGLAVVKGLVEAHGGRVWADNRADGGARFTFTLPIDEAQTEVA